MKTQYIILAAGMGKRISHFTSDPKVLLKINGQTLIDHHLEKIQKTEFGRINIVVGYQKEKIIQHLSHHPLIQSINFIDNEAYLNNGNAYSLFLGLSPIDNNPVIIIDGDTIYSEDIFLDFINNSIPDAFLIGNADPEDIESTKILINNNLIKSIADKRALNFYEKSLLDFSGEAIGLLKLSPMAAEKLKIIAMEMLSSSSRLQANWEELFKIYIHYFNLYPYKTMSNQWIEIDTLEDYKKAENIFG